MKLRQLIFFLVVAAFVASAPLLPVVSTLGRGIQLSRAEFWRLGFGPTSLFCSVSLIIASLAAYQGSKLALHFCSAWLGCFSIAFLILRAWHFSLRWDWGTVAMLAASILWYWSVVAHFVPQRNESQRVG
ncbi:MAG TPA: hypothetical protein VFW05_13390 [Verrucomicrobiae bacterium]|nr:hypothetical protein [Verrucomicrobiae bacterium]